MPSVGKRPGLGTRTPEHEKGYSRTTSRAASTRASAIAGIGVTERSRSALRKTAQQGKPLHVAPLLQTPDAGSSNRMLRAAEHHQLSDGMSDRYDVLSLFIEAASGQEHAAAEEDRGIVRPKIHSERRIVASVSIRPGSSSSRNDASWQMRMDAITFTAHCSASSGNLVSGRGS